MRVVIVGATGNAGTALLRRLWPEADLELVGVARRIPEATDAYRNVEWHGLDVAAERAADRLAGVFRGADAVINLAWQIQPSHDPRRLFRTNVLGSREIARAALTGRVGSLIQASSVGVYSPGPKDAFVTERYPRRGVLRSSYSRHKALVERMFDQVESDYPGLRVVRVRPGLIFQRESGTEISRYFAGPLLPARLLRYQRIPVVPSNRRLRLQAVHADDVSDAYARILRTDIRGAFNLVADPVLDARGIGEVFHGVRVPIPAQALVGAAALSWWSRLQPIDAGWMHLALESPLMSSARAAAELDWHPRRDALSALRELVAGIAERAHAPSRPLSGDPDLPGRPGGLQHGRLPGTGDPY
jgi:nucleoside-diphosphate-sugar epimerase